MAITPIKADYFKYNGTAWELFHFRTSADLVHETELKKFITPAEKAKIADYLTDFNLPNKLLRLNGDSKVPTNLIPNLNYVPSTGNATKTGSLTIQGGNLYLDGNTLWFKQSTYIGSDETEKLIFDSYNGFQFNSNVEIKGDLDMANRRIVNVANPTGPKDAVNKEYLENIVSSGFVTRDSVKACSNQNIDLTAVFSGKIDGVTINNNDRVLLKGQDTATQNGVYVKDGTTNKFLRVVEDSKVGSAVFVEQGDTYNDFIFHHSTENDWFPFTKPDTIKIKSGGGLEKNANNEIGIASGSIVNTMIKDGDISLSKLNKWGLDSSYFYWTATVDGGTSQTPESWIESILSAIKLLRGTDEYNENNTQTIKGAYTGFTNADNKAQQALDAIPKIVANSTAPETGFPNAKSGDLYFQIL